MRLVIIAVACLCAVVAWGQSVFDPGKTAGAVALYDSELWRINGSGAFTTGTLDRISYDASMGSNALVGTYNTGLMTRTNSVQTLFPNRGYTAWALAGPAVGGMVPAAEWPTNGYFTGQDSITVCLWYYKTSGDQNAFADGIFASFVNGSATLGFGIMSDASTDHNESWYGTATGAITTAKATLRTNEAQHILMSIGRSGCVLYKNGAAFGSFQWSAPLVQNNSFKATWSLHPGDYSDPRHIAGVYDDIIIFASSITPAEANQLYRGVYKHETATTAKNPRNDACDLTSL